MGCVAHTYISHRAKCCLHLVLRHAAGLTENVCTLSCRHWSGLVCGPLSVEFRWAAAPSGELVGGKCGFPVPKPLGKYSSLLAPRLSQEYWDAESNSASESQDGVLWECKAPKLQFYRPWPVPGASGGLGLAGKPLSRDFFASSAPEGHVF